MGNRLLGIVRHQALELGLGLLVLEMRLVGSREDRSELCPSVGRNHVNNPHGLEPRLGRLDSEQLGFFAPLDTAPELALGSHDQVLIERIGMGQDLNPFAAAGIAPPDLYSPGRDLFTHMGEYYPYGFWESTRKVSALTGAQIRSARALLKWSALELARFASLGVNTIRRAEARNEATSLTTANDLAIRHALEAAGVEFIDENGGGPGVRLRERHQKKR